MATTLPSTIARRRRRSPYRLCARSVAIGWLAVVSVLLAAPARADVAVLLPGFQTDGRVWREAGVVGALVDAGWTDGGHLRIDGDGVGARGGDTGGARTVYTAAIPTFAPLADQVTVLDRYLRHLVEAHPGESLTLVGHSAGGVLARLQMVKHPDVPVATLITIASPHLGLEVADIAARLGGELMQELARSLGEPMAEELVRRFGLGVANDTLSLLGELATERPGNLLHWLNHQPHPPARYVAVVRDTATPIGFLGHLLLSSRSQDMGNVEALHGRVTTVRFGEDHLLTADDGPFLARLLGSLRISRLPSQRHDLALRSP